MKREIIYLIYFAIYFSLTASAQTLQKNHETIFPSGETYKESTITYKLIPAPNNTWGYDILVDNKLTIHQPSIPGVSGNEGFKTKTAAQKVAALVISKMKKGEMPPSVTLEEMKNMKVL